MKNFTEYHRILLNRAVARTLSDLGYNKPLYVVRSMTAWFIGACIIYKWDSGMFSEEIPFWLAALASIGAIVVITFLYEWSRQGVSLLNEVEHDMSILEESVNKIKQQEDIVIGACNLHKKGRAIYDEGFSNEKTYLIWDAKMQEWSNEVIEYFSKKTNASLIHALDNTYQSTWFDFGVNLEQFDGAQKKAEKYSGRMMVVDDFIKDNATNWRNDLG